MQTIRRLADLREALQVWRADGARVALVPTMGALHAGHMALVEEAARAADKVVVSIFVNPMQFGANEDLDRYPRREATDSRMLADAGVDLLWMPPVDEVYPAGFATSVRVGGVSEGYEADVRAGHFDGVATVVLKLLNQVRPDVALFGEKDFQQLAVIRRLVADLDLEVAIRAVPTQRDDDGLALSSRNAYLAPDDRARAVALPRALGFAAAAIARGGDREVALATARDSLTGAGFEVDYVALVDGETLGTPRDGAPARLIAAARIGGTRLLDNLAVENIEQR